MRIGRMSLCARVLRRSYHPNPLAISFNARPRVMAFASRARRSPSPAASLSISPACPCSFPLPPPRQSTRAHRHVRSEQDGAARAGGYGRGQEAWATWGRGGVFGANTAVTAPATAGCPTLGWGPGSLPLAPQHPNVLATLRLVCCTFPGAPCTIPSPAQLPYPSHTQPAPCILPLPSTYAS